MSLSINGNRQNYASKPFFGQKSLSELTKRLQNEDETIARMIKSATKDEVNLSNKPKDRIEAVVALAKEEGAVDPHDNLVVKKKK